jgi:uncharacterized protein (TIGR04255 family)
VATQRHLPNAPITEAVIDIQVEPTPDSSFSDFEKAVEPLDFGYRQAGAVVSGLFSMTTDASGSAQSSGTAERIGVRLHSNDDQYVVLARVNGLSVSRLPPYENWERLEAEARRVWDLYLRRLRPRKVTRIATRYINNLKLPMESGQDLSTFFDTVTELPPAVPQTITSFLQTFQLVDSQSNGTARLGVVWDGKGLSGNVPVILDVDAFVQESFDPGAEAIWIRLRQLRDLKNRCFFGVLTEEAIRNYL